MKKHRLSLLFALACVVNGCADAIRPLGDASADRGAVMDSSSERDAAMDATSDVAMDATGRDSGADVRDATVVPDSSAADAALSCGTGPRDCEPGDGTGEGDQCFAATSCFLRAVQNAIRVVVSSNPTWFDASMGGSPRVLNESGYMNGVVMELRNGGLCAIIDPNAGDEIVVKHDNTLSENFDILTADNLVRSGGGIYTSTCAPAWF